MGFYLPSIFLCSVMRTTLSVKEASALLGQTVYVFRQNAKENGRFCDVISHGKRTTYIPRTIEIYEYLEKLQRYKKDIEING